MGMSGARCACATAATNTNPDIYAHAHINTNPNIYAHAHTNQYTNSHSNANSVDLDKALGKERNAANEARKLERTRYSVDNLLSSFIVIRLYAWADEQ